MQLSRVVPLFALLASTNIAIAQTPVLANNGVVNGITYAAGPLAPGSIASIFGSALAASLALADSVPLSTNLADVSVTVNGIAAPLYFVSSGQVNIQVPWNVLPDGTNSGSASVVVTRQGVPSAAQSVQIAPVSPALFTLAPDGAGNAIAINPDGSIAAPAGAVPGLTSHPAKAGDALILLATGLGAVNPTIASGASSSDQLRNTVQTPTVLIGGQPAQLLFSGLSPSFTGVNQINVIVPSSSGNAIPIQLQVGGITTSNQVTIAIQ